MNAEHVNQPPDELFPDEPWESEISSLLGRLEMIDPPPGFIEAAIDHRPLFAGRLLVGLMAAATVVFAATFTLGAFGHPRLLPELSTLTSSGAMVQNGGTRSVFRQPGSLELDELPGGTRIVLAGRDAWVDAEKDMVVVADDGVVVTMVGVTPDEAEALMDDIDGGPGGVAGIINRLTAAVGFPDLS